MIEKAQQLYKEKNIAIKFGIIGGVGFVTNYAVLKLGIGQGLNKIVAEILAALLALQVTFIFHDKWTYKIDKTKHNYNLPFSKRYRIYLISNSFGSLMVVVFFALFTLFLGHFFALALAAVAGLIWNYVINKTVIWHHQPHSKS